jgi:hypothetical protein
MRSKRPGHRRRGIHPSTRAMALALLLGLAACAGSGPGAGSSGDPANPLDLNEIAVASAARGDIETAWLLLERAARLAPHDTRIAVNLDAVREFRLTSPRGKIVGAAPPGGAGR